MPSGGVVEAFYEVEDGGAGLVAGVVGVAVEEFGLQRGEERFCYCIDAPIVKFWVLGVGVVCCRVLWSVMTRW